MHIDLEAFVMYFSPEEVRQILQQDHPFLEEFCQKYNVELVTLSPNLEDFPPEGLMYFFTDNLGGYSIKGIKADLKAGPELEQKSRR